MKKKNHTWVIFLIIFALLLILGIVIYFQNIEHSEKKETEPKSVEKTQSEKSDQKKIDSSETETPSETISPEVENQTIDEMNVNEIVTPPASVTSEQDVITYMNEMEQAVNNDSVDKTSNDWKMKAKKVFITVTDFIFYGGEIGGYTFRELSDSAKETVINVALSIDETIESYAPNYKETLVSQGTKTYETVKDKLVDLKDQYFEDVKTVIGEENYQKAGEVYDNVKEKAGTVKDKVVDKSKEIYEAGKDIAGNVKDKLSDWYQSFKNE